MKLFKRCKKKIADQIKGIERENTRTTVQKLKLIVW